MAAARATVTSTNPRGDATKHRVFFYLAPVGVETEQIVASGLLPLTKSQVSNLRSENSLPNPGDTIIVMRIKRTTRKSVQRSRYDVVSLCEAVNPCRKLKQSDGRIAPDLSRAVGVREVSVGKANQRSRAAVIGPKGKVAPPALLPASEADYKGASRRFPLLTLRDKITHLVPKTKVVEDSLAGYVYDLQTRRLCGIGEVLPRVGNSLLEREMERRVTGKEGCEMVDRLHTRALQAQGADLQSLTWEKFESFCAELVKRHGFDVVRTKATGDGGVDFYAIDHKDAFRGGSYVFQVKHTASVDVHVVRQMCAALRRENALKGVILTSGTFTAAAKNEAEAFNMGLLGAKELSPLIGKLHNVPPHE